MDKEIPHGQWSSSTSFILAAAGAAVGLGNIWKFPYIAGENGGGAFVAIYLLCILFIGVPLLMAEVMLGRAGKKNPDHTMFKLANQSHCSPHWRWVGRLTVLASFLVLSYYSVIAGWALDYIMQTGSGTFLNASASKVTAQFDNFVGSPYQLAFWHTVIMVMTIGVVVMGVEKGLERAVRYMFPSMFFLLLILVGYSMNTGFFGQGLEFLFYPDFSEISAKGILSAVGHAFFTLSLAVGTIMMYGAYVPRHISIFKASIFIAIADTVIALLAGLAIFPLVFAHGLEPGAGAGLIFKTLPLAFGHMPYGTTFGTIFFVMLMFAAFTSSISLLEPSVAWCMDTFKLSRAKAAFLAGGGVWALGFVSVFSFNVWSKVKILGLSCFDFLDVLTSNYMLPIGGLFIALFAAWKYKRAEQELDLPNAFLFKIWHYSLGFITPIAIVFVFMNVVGLIHF